MKLRLLNNSIRVRLDRSEVRDLLRDGLLERRIDFGLAGSFVYAMRLRPQPTPLLAELSANRVDLFLDQVHVHQWAHSADVGISAAQHTGTGELRLLVEKDFPCRHCDNTEMSEKFSPESLPLDAVADERSS